LCWQQLRHGNRGNPVREPVPSFPRPVFRNAVRAAGWHGQQHMPPFFVLFFVVSYQFNRGTQ
jgi:hypothetical protein